MKKTLLVVCGAILTMTVFSQKCLTDQMLEARFEQNPGLREEAQRFMSNLAETENNIISERAEDTLVTLPIVFHILHDNGIGNISEEQVMDAIRVLNRDLKRENPDTTNTRAVFKPFAANINVEFRIAKIDPNGFCTNGITRHNLGAITYDARDEVKRSSTGGVDAWPVDKYFNVWVVNSIEGSGGEGIVLGYAQFPFSFGGGVNETYGIVARQDYLGTIGTSNDDGRMLTHEVGHCLGLFHTFQGGCNTSCSGGDYICDTPPTSEATYGCSSTQNTCVDPAEHPYSDASVVDQIENYMSYDNCTNMFSEGQKVRMRGVVTNNVSFFGSQQNIPQMENLTSPENLEATGVFLEGEPCQVIFMANATETCVGETVSFTDFSFHKISSWSWSFPGGEPSTSEERNPTVTYSQAGNYDVILTVSDSNGLSIDSTYVNYINVISAGEFTAPYQQNFETGTNLSAINWTPINPNNDNVFWKVSTTAGAASSQSVYLNNYNNTVYDRADILISGSYDLSGMSDASFIFDQSYAMKQTSNTDKFKIEISDDCGFSWSNLWNKSGFGIGVSSLTTANYVPTNWKHTKLDIPAQYLTSGVKFKITFIHGGGNNMYLDNFNITSTVGIDSYTQNNTISVFPNPFSDFTTMLIETPNATEAVVTLTDMIGKEHVVLPNVSLNAGQNQVRISSNELAAGVYLLKVNFENGIVQTKKVMIK